MNMYKEYTVCKCTPVSQTTIFFALFHLCCPLYESYLHIYVVHCIMFIVYCTLCDLVWAAVMGN